MSAGRRLCMVVHAYYPLGEPRVEREARAARQAGYAVSVIALRHGDEPLRQTVDGVEVHRVRLRHVRGAGLGRILFEYMTFTILASLKVMTVFRGRPDVLHVHAPPDFLIAAGMVPKLLGARLVLDIHDLSPHMYGARYRGRPGFGLVVGGLRAVERAACALADAVITVHEPYRRELAANGVPLARTAVVMNAPDDELIRRLNGKPSGARRPDAFTVAYHGTIAEWYGVDLLVRAVSELAEEGRDVRATILGDGDALGRVRALAEELGIGDRVVFSGGYLPLEETLGRVAGASCGVIPNLPSTLNRFALSTKLFEYVALGIPVAVAGLETLRAHFDEDEVTFFDPGKAESLAAALRWVADNPAAAAEKAERARARGMRDYSWTANRATYQGVLEGHAP